MSKYGSFAEYPPRSLMSAEAALLTAWASLERFHDELVLVGGLAVNYLTRPGTGLLPGPVTMDVDLASLLPQTVVSMALFRTTLWARVSSVTAMDGLLASLSPCRFSSIF